MKSKYYDYRPCGVNTGFISDIERKLSEHFSWIVTGPLPFAGGQCEGVIAMIPKDTPNAEIIACTLADCLNRQTHALTLPWNKDE